MPPGDLMIHCGDLTMQGTEEELVDIDLWFQELEPQFTHGIVYVAGNHDKMFERDGFRAKEIVKHGIYLEDSGVEIAGWNIWGSPRTPQFFNWSFMGTEEELARYWKRAPEGIDILVTHGPEYGMLDTNYEGTHCGSKSQMMVKASYKFFGHIHESYGQQKLGDTLYVNAAYMDAKYRPLNPPVVLDLC